MWIPATDQPRGGRRPSSIRARICVLILLPVAAFTWLVPTAVPASADGGPHRLNAVAGAGGISADVCALCHRAHTSQSPSGLLVAGSGDITHFCRSCHGAVGTGAGTDVDTGVQYAIGDDMRTDTVLGALRGGGFIETRMGSGNARRIRFTSDRTRDFLTKVPVGGPAPATSAHMAFPETGLTATGMTWGYGAVAESDPGTPFALGLECTSCHNPHGNGNYRILNPIPTDSGAVAPTTEVNVIDAPLPAAGDTRNYTVIQIKGSQGDDSSFLLYASQLGPYSATAGDYFHRYVPWNSSTGANDAPNGRPTSGFVDGVLVDGFDAQMTAWCTTCHTRYDGTDGSASPTGDGIFSYRHVTDLNRGCTTCHVAHGTSAVMNTDPTRDTTYAANQPFPGEAVLPSAQVGDSRLLKIDGRGTCLACHDPTDTIPVGASQGPIPSPITP